MSRNNDPLYQQAYDEVYAEYKKETLRKTSSFDVSMLIDYVIQNPFDSLKVRERYEQKVRDKNTIKG